MILRQFLHSEPVAASYLFGCGGRAAAAVVDPLGGACMREIRSTEGWKAPQ